MIEVSKKLDLLTFEPDAKYMSTFCYAVYYFTDPKLRSDFYEFMSQTKSAPTVTFFSVFLTVLLYPQIFNFVRYSEARYSHLTTIIVITGLLSFFCGWILSFFLLRKSQPWLPRLNNAKSRENLQGVFLICLTTMFATILMYRVMKGNCTGNLSFYQSGYCNPYGKFVLIYSSTF